MRCSNQKGIVLITLIIGITTALVLGTGMYMMGTTSLYSELNFNNFNKAYYLAESGVPIGKDLPATNSNGIDYTLAGTTDRINVRVVSDGSQIISTGIANPGTDFEARHRIFYSPVTPTNSPEHNTPVVNTTFTDLSALDTSGAASKVSIQAYIATGGTHVYWAAFSDVASTTNCAADPEQSSCCMGYLVVPIASNLSASLRNIWNTYGRVSYGVQVKMGWELSLPAAATGISFRWHESPDSPGKYQGYGLSFMRFTSRAVCADYIPNSIKPGAANSRHNKILVVLWEQKVVGGIETKRWLAYGELGDPGTIGDPSSNNPSQSQDPKVVGNQGWPDGMLNDDSTLTVRVTDTILMNGQRVNEIKLYYGDASNNTTFTAGTRGKDSIATNVYRDRYSPEWVNASLYPTWPSNQYGKDANGVTTYWSYTAWQSLLNYASGNFVIPLSKNGHHYRCTTAGRSGATEPVWPTSGTVLDGNVTWTEDGNDAPIQYDYFTLVSSLPPDNKVLLVLNPSATDVELLSDKCTLRTTDFALDSFDSARREIGLHAMGNISGGLNGRIVAFDDLAIVIIGRREQ
jgi:hypothetical protein